jgi:hypothetical protein
VQGDLAPVRPPPVLEQIDPLPGPQRRPPAHHRNAQLHRRQRRADVARHVVRPLVIVPIPGPLRRDLLEEVGEVGPHLRGGVLLDQQRGGGVPAEQGEQAGGDVL